MARVCPNRQSDDDRERGAQGGGYKVNGTHKEGQGEMAVYLRLWYRNAPWDCLLDTGCEHSIIPKKLLRNAQIDWSDEKLYAANGTRIGTVGSTNVTLYLDGQPLNVHALVTENISEPMLGIDWLKLGQF